ncbi:hypothetical protein D3C81_1387780 [compost metagenome]
MAGNRDPGEDMPGIIDGLEEWVMAGVSGVMSFSGMHERGLKAERRKTAWVPFLPFSPMREKGGRSAKRPSQLSAINSKHLPIPLHAHPMCPGNRSTARFDVLHEHPLAADLLRCDLDHRVAAL